METAGEAQNRRIEEAALRAWPAGQQLLFDGWVARLSDGYTKRANSASLLYPTAVSGDMQTVARIEHCYRASQLPPIFRLLSFTTPSGFDQGLAERGYREADGTLVMIRAVEPCGEPENTVRRLDLETGVAVHARITDLPARHFPAHRKILQRITGDLSFFGLFEGATIAACGLSVCDGDLVGLFDIATDLSYRRKGHGTRLVNEMLRRASLRSITTAYLQVVETNAPAIALYEGLGFHEAYRYKYRILD